METLNSEKIMNREEVGGSVACIMGCGGLCLIADVVGAAFGNATSLL